MGSRSKFSWSPRASSPGRNLHTRLVDVGKAVSLANAGAKPKDVARELKVTVQELETAIARSTRHRCGACGRGGHPRGQPPVLPPRAA